MLYFDVIVEAIFFLWSFSV